MAASSTTQDLAKKFWCQPARAHCPPMSHLDHTRLSCWRSFLQLCPTNFSIPMYIIYIGLYPDCPYIQSPGLICVHYLMANNARYSGCISDSILFQEHDGRLTGSPWQDVAIFCQIFQPFLNILHPCCPVLPFQLFEAKILHILFCPQSIINLLINS